jgi:hypothetical protein
VEDDHAYSEGLRRSPEEYEPKNVAHKMEEDENTVTAPKGCMIQIDSTELLKEDW